MGDSRTNSAKQKTNCKSGAPKSKRRRIAHEHVSKGAIRRLARRGGVKRLSALVYEEIRDVLKAYLRRLVKDSIIYCEYFKRKTVQVQDVIRALKCRGERLYGFDEPSFLSKTRPNIILNDTPEESVASTFGLTETSASVSTIENPEFLNRNIPTTSRRFSENLSDSDVVLSDIALSPKTNRSSRLISNDGYRNEDSDESDSLISPEKLKTLLLKQNRDQSTPSKNSEVPVSRTSPSKTTTNYNEASSDNLESTEENNDLLLEKENRGTVNISKNASKGSRINNHIPSTSNRSEIARDPLNVRRRRLFPNHQNSTAALVNSYEVTVNNKKVIIHEACPNDSEVDFQYNLDMHGKKSKKSSRIT